MKALTLLHDDATSRDIAVLTSKAWTDERHLYKDKAALLQIIDQSKGEYDLIIIKGHGDIVATGTTIGTPRSVLNLALNEIDEVVTRLSGHRIVTPTLILDGCYSISVASRFLPVMTKSPSTGKEPVILSYYGMSDGILASQYIEALDSGAAKPLSAAVKGVRSVLEMIQPPDPVATAKYPTPKDTSGNPIVPYVFLPIVLCGPTKFQSGPRPAYTALECSTIKYRIPLDGAPPLKWLDLRDAKGISRDSEEYSVAALDALLKYVRGQPGVALGDRNYADFVRVAERL